MKCLIGNAIWLLTVNGCATEIPPVLIPTNTTEIKLISSA